MSKYGEDIRRISRYQELLDLIQQKSNTPQDSIAKAAIDAAKGIAYNSGNGAITTASSGDAGTTKPDNDGVTVTPVDDPEQDKNDGESKNDNDSIGGDDIDNPDNTDRDGWYDIDSLLQGALDEFGKVPPSPGDGKKINSITGLYDDDDRKFITHFKDAANAFIAPDDRTDQNEKVDNPDYTPGFYYIVNNGGPSTAEDVPTVSDAIASGKSYLDATLPSPRPPVTFIGWFTGGGSPSGPPDTIGDPRLARYEDQQSNLSNITVNYAACSVTSSLYACPIAVPFLPWEDLNATQLAWVGQNSASVSPFNFSMVGKFVPHPYDSNIPTAYQNGASVLRLVNGSGNDVKIGALSADGWYVAYTDNLTGEIAGDSAAATVLKINPDRTHGGFITPSELAKKLPITGPD